MSLALVGCNLFEPTETTQTEIRGLGLIGEAPPSALTCADIPVDIADWWQAENTGIDALYTGRDGILNGNTAFDIGYVGQAFSFDGTGDWIDISGSADINAPDVVTVEAWIYMRAATYYPGIITKGNLSTGEESYALFLNSTGKLAFLVNMDGTTSGRTMLVGPAIPIDTWVHVAASFGNSTIKLYIDGVVRATKEHFGGIFPSANPIRIGMFEKSTDPSITASFSGLIDEPSIFHRELSEDEVWNLFQAGNLGKCANQIIPPAPPVDTVVTPPPPPPPPPPTPVDTVVTPPPPPAPVDPSNNGNSGNGNNGSGNGNGGSIDTTSNSNGNGNGKIKDKKGKIVTVVLSKASIQTDTNKNKKKAKDLKFKTEKETKEKAQKAAKEAEEKKKECEKKDKEKKK